MKASREYTFIYFGRAPQTTTHWDEQPWVTVFPPVNCNCMEVNRVTVWTTEPLLLGMMCEKERLLDNSKHREKFQGTLFLLIKGTNFNYQLGSHSTQKPAMPVWQTLPEHNCAWFSATWRQHAWATRYFKTRWRTGYTALWWVVWVTAMGFYYDIKLRWLMLFFHASFFISFL